MASLYMRGRQWWISYYLDGKQVKKALHTSNARVAKDECKRIESELTLGNLHVCSQIALVDALEMFCRELKATRTKKSYKNDISRLRAFFGPITESLKIRKPDNNRTYISDKYAGHHVQVTLLEDITPQTINCFLSQRLQKDGWSAKTANLMRQILHRLFAYAIKHHGFRSRDPRYINPAAFVERRLETAPHIRFLSLEDIEEQLESLKTDCTIYALVATYIYAGLRREEGLWLTHDDIDLSNRLIRVRAVLVQREMDKRLSRLSDKTCLRQGVF